MTQANRNLDTRIPVTGLWDAASSGNLVGRATFTSIVKGAADTLKVTWTWTIS